jgi:predicted extracellular nuclease
MPDRTKYFAVLAEQMEVNKFKTLFKERYQVTEDETDEENTQVEMPVVDSLSNVQDSTNTLDSLNAPAKKQLQLNDTDNSEQRLKEQEGKNNYQDTNSNADQYKLNEQDTNYETQEEDQKKKPTVEDQQKSYQQQQQLKDLFK